MEHGEEGNQSHFSSVTFVFQGVLRALLHRHPAEAMYLEGGCQADAEQATGGQPL